MPCGWSLCHRVGCRHALYSIRFLLETLGMISSPTGHRLTDYRGRKFRLKCPTLQGILGSPSPLCEPASHMPPQDGGLPSECEHAALVCCQLHTMTNTVTKSHQGGKDLFQPADCSPPSGELRAGTCRQDLKQRLERSAAFWSLLPPFCGPGPPACR